MLSIGLGAAGTNVSQMGIDLAHREFKQHQKHVSIQILGCHMFRNISRGMLLLVKRQIRPTSLTHL